MKKQLTEFQQLALSFVTEHWNEIDKQKTELHDSFKGCIRSIKKYEWYASWVITEVMCWGCDKNYIHEYIIENEDFNVYKINNKYFKSDEKIYSLIEVFPKEKTVIYFD